MKAKLIKALQAFAILVVILGLAGLTTINCSPGGGVPMRGVGSADGIYWKNGHAYYKNNNQHAWEFCCGNKNHH